MGIPNEDSYLLRQHYPAASPTLSENGSDGDERAELVEPEGDYGVAVTEVDGETVVMVVLDPDV